MIGSADKIDLQTVVKREDMVELAAVDFELPEEELIAKLME